MKVTIVNTGRYLTGMNLKGSHCKSGSVIEVPNWYGEKLILRGNAIAMVDEEPAPEKKPAKKKVEKEVQTKMKLKSSKNPFLEV